MRRDVYVLGALENRSPGLFILKWQGLNRSFEVCSAAVKEKTQTPVFSFNTAGENRDWDSRG